MVEVISDKKGLYSIAYEWERQWTRELRWHKSLEIYNDTFKGKLFSLYKAFLKRRDIHNNEKKIRYYDPKDLKPE